MKLLIKLLAIAILGVVALSIAAYFLVPPAAEKAASEGTQYALGVESSIEDIKTSLGLSSTSVGFEGFELDSPTGFSEPLLTIGGFDLGVGTKSILGDTKDVGVLRVEDVQLTLVQDGLQNNLVPILKHVRGLGDGDDSKTVDGDDRQGSPGPKLRIGKIDVSGVAARVVVKNIPGVPEYENTFEVPAYEQDLSSITGEEGMTVAELSAYFVQDMKQRALTAAEGKVPAPALSILEKTLDGGLEGGLDGALDSLEEAGKNELQDRIEGVQEKGENALEKGKSELEKAKAEAEKKAKKGIGNALEGVLGGSGGR